MRKIPIIGAVFAALAFAPAANAADPITQVFTGTPTPIPCVTQDSGDYAGQRWCGDDDGKTTPTTTVPSFDRVPIDTNVILPPAPASGEDGGFPVVGVFHGYNGYKAAPADPSVQRWLAQGYAVMSITDRGFWGSCGVLVAPINGPKTGDCAKGWIHLMSNAYEVHDAQHLLGRLADDGAIDPQRIGATGGSYGGGMAMQLGALKNRVQQTDGTLVPWTSPAKGLPMRIAATAPEYGWSDLVQSLMPNGSGLDYAADNPYQGPNGDHRFGINKKVWNDTLYAGALPFIPTANGPVRNPNGGGFYAPAGADPSANISQWYLANGSGGPYDLDPIAAEQIREFPNHGAYGTDASVAPAPALLSNGWNDDLFPVDEALRYYNKVRATHPDAPVKMYHLDFGHPNRAGTPNPQVYGGLQAAENTWFAHYVKGTGDAPADAVGGVTAAASVCPLGSAGGVFSAKNWASLAQGEIRVDGAAAQTVAPNTTPAKAFSPAGAGQAAPNVCETSPSANTPGAAVYETAAAPAGGYTIAGAPTVIADLTVQNRNDAVIGRLYDVDQAAGTERLIARGTYRPTGFGTTSRQVFQLHPQTYAIAEGHTVKLELLGRDAPYALPATDQAPVGVANLQLRVPTIEGAGAAGGQIQTPAEKVLPKGYTLAADLPKPPAPPVTDDGPRVTPLPGPVTPPTVPSPAPSPLPTPAVDPVSKAAMIKALKKAPKKVTLSRSLRVFRFTDAFPQAGRVSYELAVKVGKKLTVVGKVTRKVTKAGSIVVTIKPTAKGRATLKARPKATLVLAAKFTTAIEKKQYVSARVLKRR
jgi:hypothetical protein